LSHDTARSVIKSHVFNSAGQEGLLSLTAQRAACETCIFPIGGQCL